MTYFTREDVLKLLKSRMGMQTQTDFAEKIGVSFQLVSAIFAGKRQPSSKILKFLGLKKVVVYGKNGR